MKKKKGLYINKNITLKVHAGLVAGKPYYIFWGLQKYKKT